MRILIFFLALVAVVPRVQAKPRLPILPVIDYFKEAGHDQPTLLSSGTSDTVYFGGTTWAADSMRWEALRDSVWTFESGVGSWINTGQLPGKPLGYHGGMEGWSGFFLPYFVLPVPGRGIFRRSSTCALSGAYSLWAGADQAEANALCYAAGQGYGTEWSVSRSRAFIYPGSGSITLSYDYAVEAEPDYDYFFALVDTSGNGSAEDIPLTYHSGVVSGLETLTLTRAAGTLRSTPGPIVIRFKAESDGGYSDEDGIYPTTCGHTVIDNVALAGAVQDLSTFEAGDDGWVLDVPPPWAGDRSHLADIATLPPMQVPGPCGVADSVLVFCDENFHISSDNNQVAISPWIDLRRNEVLGRPGRFISWDIYWQDSPPLGPNYFLLMVRWYPAPCEASGGAYLTDFTWGLFSLGSITRCSAGSPLVANISSWIGADAEKVQIGLGVSGLGSSGQIWFDNVRFGVYGLPVSAVPETPAQPAMSLIGAEPNPLHSATHIRYATRSDGHVGLVVFDVAGRHVRSLVDTALPAGPHEVIWDAHDDAGRQVPAGLYFYRLTAGNFTVTRKVVVVR